MPLADNRIRYVDGQVRLDLTQTNVGGHKRLKHKLRKICDKTDIHPHMFDRSLSYRGAARRGLDAHRGKPGRRRGGRQIVGSAIARLYGA